jgi:hypothetical protein
VSHPAGDFDMTTAKIVDVPQAAMPDKSTAFKALWYKKLTDVYLKEDNGFAFGGDFVDRRHAIEIEDGDYYVRVWTDARGVKRGGLYRYVGLADEMETIVTDTSWDESFFEAVKALAKNGLLGGVKVHDKYQKRPKKGGAVAVASVAEPHTIGSTLDDRQLIHELLVRGLIGSDGRVRGTAKAAGGGDV